MKRPVILLNCNYDLKQGFRPHVGAEYTRAVRLAGGIPLLLPYQSDEADIDTVLELAQGLVITGGGDVDPVHYGEPQHVKTMLKFEEAQRFDLELIRRARSRGIPVLGICLGAQQLNVACGGGLYQDIEEQLGCKVRHRRTEAESQRPRHAIRIQPDTLLYEIVGRRELMVNTSHHQAIRALGTGLRISAHATEDDVIEAVESTGGGFFLGVQWHPEELAEPGTAHLKLFEALVAAACTRVPGS